MQGLPEDWPVNRPAQVVDCVPVHEACFAGVRDKSAQAFVLLLLIGNEVRFDELIVELAEGQRVTLGPKVRQDCVGLVNRLLRRFLKAVVTVAVEEFGHDRLPLIGV
ncbi:hypothetical protein RDJLphi1_gp27 [Roseobacter phage RDJL Phi 1]|uniref:Uncharacterized protein n=1 Tax=Roseobacter phage RDJL Phi 1 TaxID=562742 RepID=F4YXN8_9CAUD|nr:hypothetical protein RDJLphi1_gp27 [Roseobacter phage RDJL Phi 1]ADK73428.1 hypothetical protein RDJLphi1_gp27 [Roseobacter phage RDJL Phi 1]